MINTTCVTVCVCSVNTFCADYIKEMTKVLFSSRS